MLTHFSHVWLCDPMECSPPGSSVHGISQARILEWVSTSSSMGSSWHRDQTHISCIAGEFFTTEPLGKPPLSPIRQHKITIRNKRKKLNLKKRKKILYAIPGHVSLVRLVFFYIRQSFKAFSTSLLLNLLLIVIYLYSNYKWDLHSILSFSSL